MFFLLASVLVGIVTTVHAQTESSGSNKSLLWRISGKQMNKPSYLFGTIHLICKDDYIWTSKMEESLQNSDEVCFEMDMDDPSVMMQVAVSMMDKSGKKLSDYFTPKQYALVTKYLKDSLNIDISMFEQMKPIALESFFSLKEATCTNPVSYEETLMAEAKKANKEIVGLEEPQEQIALLDKIPTDSIVKELMDDIKGLNKTDDEEYKKLITAYKNQDLPALYNLIQKSKNAGNDLDAFLDERNRKWIDRMIDKMEQKSVFFAVGAGHLWGPNGVINLLRKNGYTVVPVK